MTQPPTIGTEETAELAFETRAPSAENGREGKGGEEREKEHSSERENGRSTRQALVDRICAETFAVLDTGFVRLVDVMGGDGAVVQAARVSYGKGTKSFRADRALIRYLMRHRHNSPFEMCEVKLHVKLPIFVARQWVRHRTASLNEYSARYSVLEEEFFVPKDLPLFAEQDFARQSSRNRQGREEGGLSEGGWKKIKDRMRDRSRGAFLAYREWLGMGLTRELARIALPLSTYTEFYWKANLHNLLHFLQLRMDSHAQREIRVYAETIFRRIVEPLFPLTSEAFSDYRLRGVHLSRAEVDVLRRALSGENVSRPAGDTLSKREWEEFTRVFGVGSAVEDSERS